MSADTNMTTLSVRVPPEVMQLLERVTDRLRGDADADVVKVDRAALLRSALRIGLEAIDTDPAALKGGGGAPRTKSRKRS